MAIYSGDGKVTLKSGIRPLFRTSGPGPRISVLVAGIFIAWICAWIIEQSLSRQFNWLSTGGGQFTYWTVGRLVIWVLPAVAFIHLSGQRLKALYAADRWKEAVIWGVGFGLAMAAIAVLEIIFLRQPLFAPSLEWGFFNAVLVAPIVEELVFRGAVLGALLPRYRFFTANTATAVLFLGIHLPGWYFQGSLITMLETPAGGALSIFLIGWALGYVKYKSRSLLGSTLAHVLNNLISAIV